MDDDDAWAMEERMWTGSAAAPYHARCSSTYRRADQGWRLVQHQQTPMS